MSKKTRDATADLKGTLIRLRAVLAVLDEMLDARVTHESGRLHQGVHSRDDAVARLALLEGSLATLDTESRQLRTAADLERRECWRWEQRLVSAAAEQRHDLAQHAAHRLAEHLQNAELVEDELHECDALGQEHREAISTLRTP